MLDWFIVRYRYCIGLVQINASFGFALIFVAPPPAFAGVAASPWLWEHACRGWQGLAILSPPSVISRSLWLSPPSPLQRDCLVRLDHALLPTVCLVDHGAGPVLVIVHALF